MNDENYNVYCEFNLEKHKQTFTDYFETAILPNGKVEYVIPSHNEYLYKYLERKKGITREELFNLPQIAYEKIINSSGLILCWSCKYEVLTLTPTNEQIKMLAKLIEEGLTTNE